MKQLLHLMNSNITLSKDEELSIVINGTALSEGTHNGVFYPKEELAKGYSSLVGKKLMIDHSKSVRDIVGTVENSTWDETNKKIIFHALVKDKEIADKVKQGLIDSVSVGVYCDITETDEMISAYDLQFEELSLVAFPADENAKIEQNTKKILYNFKNRGENMAKKIKNEDMPEDTGVGVPEDKDAIIAALKERISALESQIASVSETVKDVAAVADKVEGVASDVSDTSETVEEMKKDIENMKKQFETMSKEFTDKKSMKTKQENSDKVYFEELSVNKGEISPGKYDPYLGLKQ